MNKCFCCKEEISEHSQACGHCARTCMIIRYQNPDYTCVPECSDCGSTTANVLPSAAQVGKYYCDACWDIRKQQSNS